MVYGEARGNPMFPTIARASAFGLLNLPPKPEYANVAQEAIRGFLLLGDKRRTEAWTKLALTAAYNNARAMCSWIASSAAGAWPVRIFSKIAI